MKEKFEVNDIVRIAQCSLIDRFGTLMTSDEIELVDERPLPKEAIVIITKVYQDEELGQRFDGKAWNSDMEAYITRNTEKSRIQFRLCDVTEFIGEPCLSALKQAARDAFRNVSFSSDERGAAVIRDYSAELEEDMAGIPEAEREPYRQRYHRQLHAYLASMSRVASPMITGPARFPVEQMRKRSNSADKRYDEFREWRKRALNAIAREERKKAIPPRETPANANKIEEYGPITLVYNYEIDRVQVIFPTKPSKEVCRIMAKDHAFRWSPTQNAWQRQLTNNGINAAKRAINQIQTANAY